MHRVCKLKHDQLRIIHNIFFTNRLHDSFRITVENNVFIRHQSTNINPNVITKKLRKKRMRSNKKYAELLVGKLSLVGDVVQTRINYF